MKKKEFGNTDLGIALGIAAVIFSVLFPLALVIIFADPV